MHGKGIAPCLLSVMIDVTDAAVALGAMQVALDVFGRLEVVVNNVRHGKIAPFEQVSEADFLALPLGAQPTTRFFCSTS